MKKVKTRQEIAEEYGISRRTFQRWLKKQNIELPAGLLTPREQEIIYQNFGYPHRMNRAQMTFQRA